MRLNDASTCISFSLCLSSRTNAMCVYSVYTRRETNETCIPGNFWRGGRWIDVAVSNIIGRERERGGGRVARPILVVIVPTERAREADTSDRVSTIRDHLSTIETPLRSRGACCVAVKCTACTLRPGILFVNARIRWSYSLCTNVSSCRGVVTPFVGQKQLAARSVFACHGVVAI